MKTLGFIGGGRITRILLNGFKNAGVSFGKISVYETNETVLNTLKNEFPQIGTSVADPSTAAAADWVFIALHPPVLMETLNSIRNSVRKDALVISLAPKITIEKIRSVLTAVPGIGRMNPNAGSYVRKGFNPVCFVQETDKNAVKEIEKALQQSGLPLSVVADSNGIRASIPQLTEESKRVVVKLVKEKLEEARVSVRMVRQNTDKDIDAKEKEGEFAEDDKFRAKEELQKLVTEANNSLEDIFNKKETDIMTV